MRILSRSIFREVVVSALLGTVLFTFVLFLQRAGKLFETLVRSSAPPATVAQLFAMDIPFTFSFTIPLGVLVGVLITLNRMSADGEITGMRAAGVSSRKVVPPILAFATLAMAITAFATLWLTPYSISRTYRIVNQLLAAELTAEVQPRVFEEQFPNKILYIGDVIPGPVARWRNVFVADMTTPEDRTNEGHERSDEPRITVASQALAVPDVAHNLIQLSMLDESSYEVGKEVALYYKSESPKGDQILQASRPNEVHAKGYTEMDTVPLYRTAYHDATLTTAQKDRSAARIAAPAFSSAGLCIARIDGHSAGRFNAQGGQVHGVRRHDGAGVSVLDGTDRDGGPGQAAEAAGRGGGMDAERRLRDHRPVVPYPAGSAGTAGLGGHGEGLDGSLGLKISGGLRFGFSKRAAASGLCVFRTDRRLVRARRVCILFCAATDELRSDDPGLHLL